MRIFTALIERRLQAGNSISTVIPLEIWDCPGNITVETLGAPLSQFSTIIFVIDIRVSHQVRIQDVSYISGSGLLGFV